MKVRILQSDRKFTAAATEEIDNLRSKISVRGGVHEKRVVVAIFILAVLPISACNNNSEQAAYMQSPTAEANAKEAEQAEAEFAKLSSEKATSSKSSGQKTAKGVVREEKRKPASAVSSHKQPHSTDHFSVASSAQKVWTVQLGAFKVKENAEKLTSKLKTDGFPVLMREMNHSKNGELYVVHLEPTPNKSEAEKWQTDLKLKSFDSTLTLKRD